MIDKYSMPQMLGSAAGGQFHVMAKPSRIDLQSGLQILLLFKQGNVARTVPAPADERRDTGALHQAIYRRRDGPGGCVFLARRRAHAARS